MSDKLLLDAAVGPTSTNGFYEAAESETPLLELWGIVKQWPRQPRRVLSDLELEVPAGAAISIRGRNGVGKTTLLRIISGVIMPDEGFVRLSHLDPHHDRIAYQRRLSFLTAGDRGMYARLTVRQQLTFWASLTGISRRERKPAIEAAILDFALDELATRRVDRLSMGQRQRVRLAGTFLHKPSIALLDEPRNSLDDEGIAVLLGVVRRLIDSGGSVIWCSPSGETTGLEFTASYVLADGTLNPE